MSKRSAVLAAEIEVGDKVFVNHLSPALVIVTEVQRPTRGARHGQTGVRRASSRGWIWLDNDKTYPMIDPQEGS